MPSQVPKVAPTSRTAKGCMVMGTGVKAVVMLTRADAAMKSDPRMTRSALRTMVRCGKST